MKPEVGQQLAAFLLGRADDELILAHRNSEWTGHAPILEEDIAFTNLALDEMGHAQLLYGLFAQLTEQDGGQTPDQLIYFREAPAFRNVQMAELPKGDWAYSMLRQYLFDSVEAAWLPGLQASAYRPLAEAAAKIAAEERYHLRHTQAWVRRLAGGTEESHRRMQAALDRQWLLAQQWFQRLPDEDGLVAAGLIPDAGDLAAAWSQTQMAFLEGCGLTLPALDGRLPTRQEHTEHLVDLLSELQQVARAHPGAEW
ncbi:MAG TPA: 1,2-phenylacetyl-CoA epoxidase subunit PaaC [Anaerolineales bacterium]|jgi:ring-1,2-phenylacetyl-CoA epoxidase subunit PaaC